MTLTAYHSTGGDCANESDPTRNHYVLILRRNATPILAGAICFVYALLAWFAVDPNQDILADGIQAQSLLNDPRIVLAFPGQKHGGPLEYPFTVLAEWLAPGNFYANAAIRPFLAFLTGFFVAKLFIALFPTAPRWAFIIGIAVGPPVMHGYIGPEGAVGVWWLQPNWDMAWLLIAAGAYTLTKSAARQRKSTHLLGGFLVGLGFFAHPATILLIIPLMTLVLLRSKHRVVNIAIGIVGASIAVIPAAISYVVNSGVNTWDPSHGAFISIDWYRGMGGQVLGLTGIPDHMLALLPYAAGLPPSQNFLSGPVQSALMWILLIAVITTATVALFRLIRFKSRPSVAGSLGITWLVLILTMIFYITFIDQVWLYSSSLAVLFWVSIGAMPIATNRKTVATGLTGTILVITGLSSLTHNWSYWSNYTTLVQQKQQIQNTNMETARLLKSAGVQFIFGSYYDAIPIAYATGGDIRVITETYNRFPISNFEAQQDELLVAQVNSEYLSDTARLSNICDSVDTPIELTQRQIKLFKCSPPALQ